MNIFAWKYVLAALAAIVIFNSLPPKWRLIVARLLEKQRVRRPADASQVATILRRIGGLCA